MSWIWSLIASGGLIAIIAVGLAAAGFLAPIVNALSPILKGAATLIGDGLVFLWSKIVRPGLEDILDNAATLVLVAAMCVATFWAGQLGAYNADLRSSAFQRDLATCQQALKAKGKAIKPATRPEQLQFKWPWE